MKNTKYVCIVKKWYPVDDEGPKPKYNEVVTKTREIPSIFSIFMVFQLNKKDLS